MVISQLNFRLHFLQYNGLAVLNVNTDAVVKFSLNLERLNKTSFPFAIRQTLNKAAFDVKGKSMPKVAIRNFTIRQKNFFKANSRVNLARGLKINSLRSEVGFMDRGRFNSDAIQNLKKQEFGGVIKDRSFIPTNAARSGSSKKNVSPRNRLKRLKNVVDANNARGKNRRVKWIKSAIHAGKGGHVITNFRNRAVVKIKSIKRSKKGIKIKTKNIYTFEKNRDVKVKGTGFMRKATVESTKKMERWFIDEAKKQIKRFK